MYIYTHTNAHTQIYILSLIIRHLKRIIRVAHKRG